MADTLKEQEEELQNLKSEQETQMMELIKSQQFAKNDKSAAESDITQTHAGIGLPGYILDELQAGRTPEASQFNAVTVFYTGNGFHIFSTNC